MQMESINYLDLSLSQMRLEMQKPRQEKENKNVLKVPEPEYFIEDLIGFLKQIENNKHIQYEKNLNSSTSRPCRELIEVVERIVAYVFVNDQGKLIHENIEKVKRCGYIIFPMRKKGEEWLDITICTKKGQIRIN
jgi:hypothetical protein